MHFLCNPYHQLSVIKDIVTPVLARSNCCRKFFLVPESLWFSKEMDLGTISFFKCYLAVPQPTLGHSQGDSLTNMMLITAFVQFRPEGHCEPCNEVGSLRPAGCLVMFELETFQFWLQCLNPLGHSPRNSGSCQFFVKYETWESLGNGILPNGKEIMGYLLTLKS